MMVLSEVSVSSHERAETDPNIMLAPRLSPAFSVGFELACNVFVESLDSPLVP